MTNKLNNFILCIENIPQLKEIFISCKNLEETYDKFKFMVNEYTFEEYKNFFEELVNKNQFLSEEDLVGVTGGFSIRKMLTPFAIVTMLAGLSSGVSFAEDPSNLEVTNEPAIQSSQNSDKEYEDLKTEDLKDTRENEIEFGLKIIESMPKKGASDFEKFLKLPDQSKLNKTRLMNLKHKSGATETIIINEKEIYDQIEKTVKDLISKVESRTPTEKMDNEEIEAKIANKEISKHYKRSKQMRIAKAIYRWATKNIKLDYDSDTSNPENYQYRKDQDAISVFHHKMAVCQGFSRLINLMMKMAGIPSAYVESGLHAFNVIYLEDFADGQSGWTLIETTWGAQLDQGDVEKPGWDVRMFFPAFYNTNGSLKDANRAILKHNHHHIMDISTSTALDEHLGDEYWYNFKINGVKYTLFGEDGKGLIAISGNYDDPIENFVIPEEISSLNLPFRINGGIKSIILNGNEQFVGTDATYNSQGLEYIQFGDIKCSSYLEFPFIWSDKDTPVENLNIPKTLLNLNVPIQIGNGIKSIILTGDETIDISYSSDLETIDATHSNKYIVEDGILYEKTESGQKGEQIDKVCKYIQN